MREVAILGAGIGAQHLDGFLAVPDRFRVRWICDLDAARARPLCERSGARFTTDMAQVLADPAVAVVDVCLPPDLHFAACSAALEAGKQVICEKPLVPSLAQADRLAEIAARTGRQVFPVFQYRYGPGTAQLRALIAAGLAGRPLVATLETHWHRPAEYYAVPWRGTWAGERGGAILGHAIHIHDLLAWLLGPVAEVHAMLATRVNAIEVEDCAALAIRLESGALATSSVTLGAATDTSRLRLAFEHLTVESGLNPYRPAEGQWTFTARAPAEQAAVDAVLAKVTAPLAGYAGLFAAVAAALDGRPGDEVTLADARRSLEFVTAVYHSARTHAPVALPLGPEHPLYSGWTP